MRMDEDSLIHVFIVTPSSNRNHNLINRVRVIAFLLEYISLHITSSSSMSVFVLGLALYPHSSSSCQTTNKTRSHSSPPTPLPVQETAFSKIHNSNCWLSVRYCSFESSLVVTKKWRMMAIWRSRTMLMRTIDADNCD